jgi:hypothetical protein
MTQKVSDVFRGVGHLFGRSCATVVHMAAVQLTCEIDGCTASWNVASAKLMKKSMDDHRAEAHPGWVKPDARPMTPYRLDYSGRARKF